MSKLFYHVMQDSVGNLLFGVSGTMRIAGSGTLATIYGDEALTVILPNPMTNHSSYGSFKCFLGVGDYDFYMAKSGYTFETLTGVQGSGTMADQNASNVAITGGTATFATVTVSGNTNFNGNVAVNSGTLVVYPLTTLTTLDVNGATRFITPGGVVALENPTTQRYNKAAQHGLTVRPWDNDTGPGAAVLFMNVAGSFVGSIATTGAATAYNTTSDSRLKTDVDDLTGELALIQALRPVKFKWLADDSPGVGFIASEVAQHVQGVVTGEQDAVNPDGTILPQMIDHSKLVVWLVGACKTLAAQNEALQARLALLEDAVGV